MNQNPTIDQMNEAIALFEGRTFYGHTINNFGGNTGNALPEMKYHSSWDWLHGAWDKFKALNFVGHPLVGDFMAHLDCISQYMAFRAISETHLAIFKAIQWYNKQQSNEIPS